MKVIIAGGGTAGHVFPAIAVARKLVDQHGAEVTFLGTATGQEARLVPAAGFHLVETQAKPLLRKASLATLRAPFVALASVRRCRPMVREADVVLGMGGYVSGPPVIAAWRSRTPVVVHEQNAFPGLANRLFSRIAKVTALSFAEAARALPRRAVSEVTGNPIRDVVAAVPAERDRLAKEAHAELDLDPDRRTVVIFGGSQGALHVTCSCWCSPERRITRRRSADCRRAGRCGSARCRSSIAWSWRTRWRTWSWPGRGRRRSPRSPRVASRRC